MSITMGLPVAHQIITLQGNILHIFLQEDILIFFPIKIIRIGLIEEQHDAC